MSSGNDSLNAIYDLCRRKVLAFAELSAPEWQSNPAVQIAAIYAIVTRNYLSGRIQRIDKLEADARLGLRALDVYVGKVILNYHQSHARVERLHQYDQDEWKDLLAILTRSAAYYVRKHGSRLQDTPDEHAQEACLRIRQSVYPFDVAFDAWARRILYNLIVEAWRNRDALDEADFTFLPLDSSNLSDAEGESARSQHEQTVDERAKRGFKQVDDADLLQRALRKLRSKLQRTVLVLEHHEGLTDVQIAEQMGRSVGAIQLLRHHALRNLRKIMAELKESGED